MALRIDSKFTKSGNYWQIKPVGEVDIANVAKFRNALNEAYETERADIRLDASELSYIDSTGLGVIIGAFGRTQESGHQIYIENPRANVKKLLQITSLDKIFCSR
jgi:anti-sigma B factor antagonist